MSKTQPGTAGGTGSRGTGWFKIAGILAIIGLLVAVGRIVLRVFREEPETPNDDEHHEAA